MSTIPDLWHKPITRYEDGRGFFTEIFRTSRYASTLPADYAVAQINHSRNKAGVLRGIHVEPWHKLITVIRGSVQVGIVDLRPNATGTYFATLNEGEVLFVPKGCGNSFQALTDADYLYAVSNEWTPGMVYPSISLKHAPTLELPYAGIEKLDELVAAGLVTQKDLDSGTPDDARTLLATLL